MVWADLDGLRLLAIGSFLVRIARVATVRGSGSTGRLIRRAALKPKKQPTDAQLLASAKRSATVAKRRGKVIG